MKKILLSLAACALFVSCAEKENVVYMHDTAVKVYQKGLEFPDNYMMGTYRGSCLLHAIADLAVTNNDKADLAVAKDLIHRTYNGDIEYHGNFYSYLNGGSATSLLYWAGESDLKEIAETGSARAWKDQTRTFDGYITSNHVAKYPNRHFIDVVFATTPFFLYEGLAEGNQEYIDLAAYETVGTLELLYDETTGLEHQGRGWPDPETRDISQDCWSRGNGWGSMGLVALLRDLPKDNKYYEDVVRIAKRFYTAVLKYQDPETGLWHQELTDPSTYTEISGSALLLAGVGQAIESGIIGKENLPAFKKGLKGLFAYIEADGSVGQSCCGCLCPGKATKHDYAIRPYVFNEAHAFGPTVFALNQAIRLGIKKITLDQPMGYANEGKHPGTFCKLVTERKNEVAWENDLSAYRLYSQVGAPGASGLDYWAKSVDFPIINKWYAGMNAWEADSTKGGSYHVDHGEGCDFYTVGKNPHRGVGGTGVMSKGKVYVSKAYASFKEIANTDRFASFEITYDPYEVGGITVTETKRIDIVPATPFFKVTATFVTSDGSDVYAIVGLTKQQNESKVLKDQERGIIMQFAHPEGMPQVASGIVVNPEYKPEFIEKDGDDIAKFKVKSGEPVIYFAGAGNQSHHKNRMSNWNGLFNTLNWEVLKEQYL